MSKDHIPEYKLSKGNSDDLGFKLERLSTNSGYNPRAAHRHNFYELFFFETGSGLHMIDFHEMKIAAGQIQMLSPGQVHYMHRSPDTSGWVIKFSDELFLMNQQQDALGRYKFLNNLITEPLIEPNPDQFYQLLGILALIGSELSERKPGYDQMILNHLNIILLTCHRLFDMGQASNRSSEALLLGRFNSLLERHYLDDHNMGFYCQELQVSSDKLNQACKQRRGKTASELIAARLLLEAKRYLLFSDDSVKQIAFALNFQDDAYFNRWFKKHTNSSPGEFRDENREKYHAKPE